MTTRFVRSQAKVGSELRETWVVQDDEVLAVEPWADDATFRHVGTSVRRDGALARITGTARYAVDVVLPQMLHAKVLRSPVAHGRVATLRLDAARSLPGVRAVIGPRTPLSFAPEGACAQVLPHLGVPLLSSEPQYAGQPIACVAAETCEIAERARDALALTIASLPHVVDRDDALRDGCFAEEPRDYARGDVEAALARAPVEVTFELETPDHLQTPLEPHAAVAYWSGARLTAWVSTQAPFGVRDELAEVFGLPRTEVRVFAGLCGGGFGSKHAAAPEVVLAAELARLARRPVRLANDRHAEQLDGGRRPWARQWIRLAADREGTLLAVDLDAAIDQGRGGKVHPVHVPAMTSYRCANARARQRVLVTNRRAGNSFRGPGFVEGTACLEQAIDELAVKLDMDPLELRRRNHAGEDQTTGMPYAGKHLLACYDRAAELAGWATRAQLREPQADGLLRGLGSASVVHNGGGSPPANVIVKLDAEGRASVVTGIQEIGTGAPTTAQIVVAEELGLRLEDVVVECGATSDGAYAPPSAASQTTASVMPAVHAAAVHLRERLLELASHELEIAPEDLQLEDRCIRSRDGALRVGIVEITARLGGATLDARGARGSNPAGVAVTSSGCQIAQVAVDPQIGDVRVERIVAVHDAGRIVNRAGAEAQVEGGVIQGLAFALSEELIVDGSTGVPVNANLEAYKVPTLVDVPDIVVDFVGRPDPHNSLGVKGLGEPPIIPTAAAIANAFAHATGRRCTAFPMTPSRVLEALR